MNKEAMNNHTRYLQRIELYRNYGYDVDKERNFIIDKAEPLYGDILEIGTGKGYLAVVLAKRGYNFVTVDVSATEQSIARLNIEHFGLEKQVSFKIENAERLSFKDQAFDIIFSVNMVHHLTNPLSVIDEMIRLVSFEGKIILSDFTKEGLELIDRVHASEGRKHGFTQAKLSDIERHFLSKSFRTEKYSDTFQEVLIAYHQLI